MPEIAELLRWYELDEALALFIDPELAEKIELASPYRGYLAKTKVEVIHGIKWRSRGMHVPRNLPPRERTHIWAGSELGKLLVERKRAFHNKLLAGELHASAKKRISDTDRIFVEPDDWRYLNLSQDGRAITVDGSETLYSLRFRNIPPFLFGSTESNLSEIDLNGLKAQDQAMIFALKLYPNGRIEPTLKATQASIRAAIKKAGLSPVSDNTITTALEKLGFYKTKPHRKKS